MPFCRPGLIDVRTVALIGVVLFQPWVGSAAGAGDGLGPPRFRDPDSPSVIGSAAVGTTPLQGSTRGPLGVTRRDATAGATSAFADGVWSELSGPFLEPRYFHTAVFDPVDRQIVLYGGRAPETLANPQPWAYSLEEDRWRELATQGPTPPPRWQHNAIIDPSRHRMIVYGGSDPAQGGSDRDVWALTLGPAPTWTLLPSDSFPPPTLFGRLAVHDPVGDRMIMIGSLPGTSGIDQVWAFDLGGGSGWRRLSVTGSSPPVRAYASAIYDPARDRVVMFGGVFEGVSKSDTWELQLGAAPEWRMLSPGGVAPAPRYGHSAIHDPAGDRMIVGGGTWWSLALEGGTAWTQLGPAGTPPPTRAFHAAVLDPASHRMFVVFGLGGATVILPDMPVLDLSVGATWTTLDGAGADILAFPRAFHRAVHDPGAGRMLVFGGQFGSWAAGCPRSDRVAYVYPTGVAALTLGGRPGWVAPSATGPVPSGRLSPSLILDTARRRIVVFGGLRLLFDGCDPHSGYDTYRWESLNDLWELDLDPVPTWSPLAPSGPGPSPRGYHATIHDPVNDRMILSGGRDPVTGTSFTDTWSLSLGGVPEWTTLETTGVPPTPGSDLQGIFDPLRNRMLVFGSSDGRILQLSLDGAPAWTELVTPGGPVPRPRQASVCYDSQRDRVILFGGVTSVYSNDVWALTLSPEPGWVRLAPAGSLPPPRAGHTAIYQPEYDRMIVHGGDLPVAAGQVVGRRDTWMLTWDSPTATAVSRIRAVATSRAVSIEWWVPEPAGTAYVVSRRTGADDWDAIARVGPDGSGIIRFEDTEVTPGTRVSYRLGANDGSEIRWLDEVELQIPGQAGLGLGAIRPNPTGGTTSIDLILPDSGEALLELVDLAGRVVRSRTVRAPAPGPHTIELTTGGMAPGVYLARVSAAGVARAAKLVILRR